MKMGNLFVLSCICGVCLLCGCSPRPAHPVVNRQVCDIQIHDMGVSVYVRGKYLSSSAARERATYDALTKGDAWVGTALKLTSGTSGDVLCEVAVQKAVGASNGVMNVSLNDSATFGGVSLRFVSDEWKLAEHEGLNEHQIPHGGTDVATRYWQYEVPSNAAAFPIDLTMLPTYPLESSTHNM